MSRLYPRLLLSLGAILVATAGFEIGLRVLGRPRFLEPHSDPLRFAMTDRQTASGPLYVNHPGRMTFRYDGNPRGYFDALNEVHHDVNPTGFRGPAFTPKPAPKQYTSDGTLSLRPLIGDQLRTAGT